MASWGRPYDPAWSVLVIGIDIVVIWAVANRQLEPL
ncbi:DUF7144 family membrane protein [Nocardia rhizosphaerae]